MVTPTIGLLVRDGQADGGERGGRRDPNNVGGSGATISDRETMTTSP